VGSILVLIGCFLSFPLLLILFDRINGGGTRLTLAFMVPSILAFVSGLSLKRFFNPGIPTRSQSMLICAVAWLICSGIGAIPFVIGIGARYIDAFFETMSGFTTTGITMFAGLDDMPRSIIFWRALTQWIGGLGILTFFLFVSEGGTAHHTLYGAESHKIESGRPVPGIHHTIRILWLIYSGFTVLIILLLIIAGMSVFDGICHSFTALSTGGFSPYDSSIEHYGLNGTGNHRLIEYILILGMILGGTNFMVHYRVLRGSKKALFDSMEIRMWWVVLGLFTLFVYIDSRVNNGSTSLLDIFGDDLRGVEERLRISLFQVVSIATTTGFGTKDIGLPYFGAAAKQAFLVLMIIGGCVGSTGGGIKVFRISLLLKLIQREIFRILAPRRAVSPLVIDKRIMDIEEIQRISALFFAWMGLLFIGGCITAIGTHHGAFESFSGMCSALGNIGPCYISVADMNQLPDFVKITYILGMLAGRLEIIPVLLLFNPRAWKR